MQVSGLFESVFIGRAIVGHPSAKCGFVPVLGKILKGIEGTKMSSNIVCFLCRIFFKGKSVVRYALWKAVWRCGADRLLCQYLLSNGSCGKSKGMTRQKLVHWFKTAGKEIVETWVKLGTPGSIELVGKDGKTVGKLQVCSTSYTKKPRRHLDGL